MLRRALSETPSHAGILSYHPSKHKLVPLGGALLGIFFILVPACVRWMILGAVLASAAILTYLWLNTRHTRLEPIIVPDLASLPPLRVPEIRPSGTGDAQLTAWFNEIDDYDCEMYSVQQTTSVFLELKHMELCLQTPKRNIESYAVWNEELPTSFKIIKLRTYNLVGATVALLPNDLTVKRLWSKKFPICITIPFQGHHRSASRVSLAEAATESTRPFSDQLEVNIYLFARSSRDKEEWYRRLFAAASGYPLPTDILSVLSVTSVSPATVRKNEPNRSDPDLSDSSSTTSEEPSHSERLASYLDYMAQVIPAEVQRSWRTHPDARLQRAGSQLHTSISCEPQIAWLNALMTRCFWDCLKDRFWLDVIQEKLQKRINKIQVPYFIDDVLITGINPGSEMPVIQRAAMPYIDERGLWADVDITYTGGFCMQIETKCNLLKLTKRDQDKSKDSSQDNVQGSDSDDDDSEESPQEEDAKSNSGVSIKRRPSRRSKILRGLEKLAHSRYVHKATENKYIKKKLDKVSNTRLVLAVEVNHVSGCLAINIPHPPSDRVWFGFRTNPCLRLTAKPSIGEKKLGLSRVIDWIEKKLAVEFRRFAVMPNMQNIPIALMSDKPSPGNSQPSEI